MATVVEAVGSSSNTLDPQKRGLSQMIERAMAQAVQDCVEAGVSLSDSETIKAAMMEARERVKQGIAAKAISLEAKPSRRGALPKPKV